jgi:hypothetical protein
MLGLPEGLLHLVAGIKVGQLHVRQFSFGEALNFVPQSNASPPFGEQCPQPAPRWQLTETRYADAPHSTIASFTRHRARPVKACTYPVTCVTAALLGKGIPLTSRLLGLARTVPHK